MWTARCSTTTRRSPTAPAPRCAPRWTPVRVRARHRPPAALGAPGRRRAGVRADGGVRQRRSDLRPRHRPHRVGAHVVRGRAGRARRDRHPRHPRRGSGRGAGRPQRPRRGDAAVRQLAGLRARLAQPGQHRGVRRGPAQRARGQAADPQGRVRAAPTWPPRWPNTLGCKAISPTPPTTGSSRWCRWASARPPGSRSWHARSASPPRTWSRSATCPTTCRCCGWAGLGVAMGNAHPEAVAAADEVTATNTDDGVARVLERWWL